MIQTLTSQTDQEVLKQAVLESNDLKGDMAEVGVFMGGSAKIILENTLKPVHLFDTFTGLPHSEGAFTKGEYKCSFDEVVENLMQFNHKKIYRGLFPDTTSNMSANTFCLVHLDCDLTKSIIDGLNFFYPKMVSGGSILIHDLDNPNVIKAVRDFFDDKPEKEVVGNYRIIKC